MAHNRSTALTVQQLNPHRLECRLDDLFRIVLPDRSLRDRQNEILAPLALAVSPTLLVFAFFVLLRFVALDDDDIVVA